MTDLHLKPTQDGTGVRLYPANYMFFHKRNDSWQIDLDAAVPVDVATSIFTAFHTLRGKHGLSATRLANYLNLFLTGKRLVICNGCTLRTIGHNSDTLISTSRNVPAINNNTANVLGVTSLVNSLGLLGKDDVIHSMQYMPDIFEHGAVYVYVDQMLKFIIECKVK